MSLLISPPSMEKKRVLVADDDEGIRAVIGFYFTSMHCSVHACSSATAALLALREEDFDLAVIDLYLDDEPGLEILRWLAVHRPGMPSVLMSGSQDEFAIEQAKALGILEFWPKPTRFQSAHRLAHRLWSCPSVPPRRRLLGQRPALLWA